MRVTEKAVELFLVDLKKNPELCNELCSICHQTLSANNPKERVLCHEINSLGNRKLVHHKHAQCILKWMEFQLSQPSIHTIPKMTCPDCRVSLTLSMPTSEETSFFLKRIPFLALSLHKFLASGPFSSNIAYALLGETWLASKSIAYGTMISAMISAIAYGLGHRENSKYQKLELILTKATMICCTILFIYSTSQKISAEMTRLLEQKE